MSVLTNTVPGINVMINKYSGIKMHVMHLQIERMFLEYKIQFLEYFKQGKREKKKKSEL